MIANRHTTLFTAIHNDRVVGYICSILGKRIAHIYSLAVLEAYRGKGIGSTLLEKAERHALASGAQVTQLEVKCGSNAVTLYQRSGYTMKYMKKNYYGNGKHAYSMEKQLPCWGCNDEEINTAGKRNSPADAPITA